MKEFQNRTAIVTGGAKGIGRKIVQSFAETGASVIVIDTDKESGDNLSKEYGNRVLFYHGDIAEKETLDKLTDFLFSKFRSVDYLINNACLMKGGLNSATYEDFEYVLRVGVTAPFYLTQKCIPYFSKDSSVVNISSTRAFMSQQNTESYTAAKGGINALTHGMSITLAGKTRINAIAPGWIETRGQEWSGADAAQQPVGRVGITKDIADMVLYLCSDKAGYITGQTFIIDGGMTKQMIYHNDYGWECKV
jgi:NAD(P)-dependent dehydrogenase (short-subunit alcohol dehydrogenase family)